MMVAFGENGVKTVEDLADCATDDLVGWTERKKEKDAEAVRHKGVLDGFEHRPQGRRGHDHVGARARRLDQGRGSGSRPSRRKRLPKSRAEGGNDTAAGGAQRRRRRRLDGDGRNARNIRLVAEQQLDADDADERGPLRRCIVTRAELPPDDLIRFVADPSGHIVPDLARKLPGRGVWVTAERPAVEAAIKGKRVRQEPEAAGEGSAGLAGARSTH